MNSLIFYAHNYIFLFYVEYLTYFFPFGKTIFQKNQSHF